MAAPIENDVDGHSETFTDNFKHVYKKYKRRDRPLDLSGVIDFSDEQFHKKVCIVDTK